MDTPPTLHHRSQQGSAASTLLLSLVWLALSPAIQAQTGETDTLFYFDPDALIDRCIGTILSEVDDAIYFEIDEQIDRYNLKQLQLQFVSDFCYDPIPSGTALLLFVRIGQLDSLVYGGMQIDSLPGEIVATIRFTINDSSELYPNWKTVELDTIPELQNLTESFWIQGSALRNTAWDTSSTRIGHSFTYIDPQFPYWSNGLLTREWAVRAVIETATLGTDDHPNNPPTGYKLNQSYPNPFNHSITIAYVLPEDARVRLVIYDISGREMVRLVERNEEAGYHSVSWNGKTTTGRDVPSGVYIYRLEATPAESSEPFEASRKMVLLK